MISVSMAREIPKLKKIIDKYEIFNESNMEHEQNILILMLLWEFQKGEDSFWWPYLEILPDFEVLPWENDYLEEA